MQSEFEQLMAIVKSETEKSIIHNVRELATMTGMHSNKVRALLDKGIKQGLIQSRMPRYGRVLYYAWSGTIKKYKRRPWYVRLWNKLTGR